MSFRILMFGAWICVAASATPWSRAQTTTNRLNVLFIAIDDLRPALACYGDPIAITPHIDALARRGTTFTRAYCQQALCSPSRLSLLTGRRPDTIRVWDLATHFRVALPDVVTLPQYFKSQGYHTQSIGKVYHGSGKPSKDPPSWSVPPQYDMVREPQLRYALPKNLQGKGLKRSAAEVADVDDDAYVDGLVCQAALKAIEEAQGRNQPFFLAVGFRKPHLPFCAPLKYWKLYDRGEIPLPAHGEYPLGAPQWATRSWMELEGYTDIAGQIPLGSAKVQELRHGYYACVSYVDAQVGKLLEELERRELTEQTVIVLWGDHGFHLGEQGLWTKANNYEWATRVPLILSVPSGGPPGTKTDALVELVDLYPTLAEVCGLNPPSGLEGLSLKALIADPSRPWKTAVFSQFPRERTAPRHRDHGEIMGYAVRTPRYRYVEWREWSTEEVVARELYDHEFDPEEMLNVAGQLRYGEVVEEMAGKLAAGWRNAMPPATQNAP